MSNQLLISVLLVRPRRQTSTKEKMIIWCKYADLSASKAWNVVVHYGKANRKGHWRKGLVTVFVIHVFTMGCILSCHLLPDGGTENAVPLLPWKSSKMLDIKRIDLFVHERLCFWACLVFIPMRSDTRPDTCLQNTNLCISKIWHKRWQTEQEFFMKTPSAHLKL